MTSYIYQLSDNVIYENKISIIVRKRVVNNAPAYVIREINTGIVHDNILESNLTSCNFNIIVDDFWNSFTYTGDNGAASQYAVTIVRVASLLPPSVPPSIVTVIASTTAPVQYLD